jgi:hypothetical protein
MEDRGATNYLSQEAFDELEREFGEVMEEIAGDESLENFQQE